MFIKEDYQNYYENLSTLGQSSFALIYEGIDINSKQTKAIKIYEKERVKAFLQQNLGRILAEEGFYK